MKFFHLCDEKNVLFVDNQKVILKGVCNLGWNTPLADEKEYGLKRLFQYL
jgi:hypothetical protein